MNEIPTVLVRHPLAPETFMRINRSDLTDAHELWPDEGQQVVPPPPTVAKGPRGKWYVMRGSERISQGYDQEHEARAECDCVDAG